MTRVVVTGAAGFVGANVARRLIEDGHDVHLFVGPSSDRWRIESLRGDSVIHAVDLTDADATGAAIRAVRPQQVFHLAAYGAYPAQTDALRIVQTNIVGTAQLLQACVAAGVERFVHAGTSSEYGWKDHPPSEAEPLEPSSAYAAAKAAATMWCRQMARERGVGVVILRLYSVYGPFEEPSRLIPRLIAFGLQGRLPPLARPSIARDFVFVSDVAQAFASAALARVDEPGAVFNVGTGIQTTLGDVVDLVRTILDIQEEPRWSSMPDRDWDTDVWVADPSKIARELGWHPRWRLEQGLRETIGWLAGISEHHARYGILHS